MGIARGTVHYRVFRMGWSVERAMAVPPRQPGATMRRVVATLDADPTLTSYEIAERLELDDTYVRRVLRQCGRKLMRGKGQKKNAQIANA
jgi:hypothetical protein